MVTAKVAATATEASTLNCVLARNGNVDVYDKTGVEFQELFDVGSVYLQAIMPAGTTQVRVLCSAVNTEVQLNSRNIIALPVQ